MVDHNGSRNSHLEDPQDLLHIDVSKQAGFLIWHVSLLWQREMEAAVQELGLTHTQFIMLSAIQFLSEHFEAPATQSLIAQRAKVDNMVVSQVARRIEEKGWIQRLAHPSDSRAKELQLTESGQGLLLQARQRVQAAANEFFARSGDAETLRTLLDNIYTSERDAFELE